MRHSVQNIVSKLKFAWLIINILLISAANAQTTGIIGVVVDSIFQETVPGAIVRLEGARNQVITTDPDGRFEYKDLIPGNYKLTVQAFSYQSTILNSVELNPGSVAQLKIALRQIATGLDEVVVAASRTTNSQKAVIEEIRMAGQVVSGISAEQIKSSQDRDAAQVMSRIPGITITDNRFVMVRGVPERYNQVLLNNVIAPSTEIDRRTFSFDLIPSSVLDRMLVFKSGTANDVGDFAGGLIKVYTKNAVEDNFFSVAISLGYRSGTTGSEFLNAPGGSATDYLGFDNTRRLPDNFPNTHAMKEASRRSSLRAEAGRSLPNSIVPRSATALPNIGLSLSGGRKWSLGQGKTLSTVSGLNYSQSYLSYSRAFHRYFTWDLEDQSAGRSIYPWFNYEDQTYEKENRTTVISNWQLRLNANNRIDFRNLLNQIGENTTIIRTGEEFQQYAGLPRKNYMLGYRSRTIYNGQLEGNHQLNGSAGLNWILGMNYTGESEPDLRRFRTFQPTSDDEYQLILPPSSNLFDAGRYYGTLRESGLHHALNVERQFAQSSANPVTITMGYLTDYRQRTFAARYFSYIYPGQNDPAIGEQIKRMPLDQVFASENINPENGLTLEEGTRAIDQYEGSSLLTAGFVQAKIPAGQFQFNAGLRMEYNLQQLHSRDDAGAALEVYNPVLSPLGFFNADYELDDKSKIRFAYGRTVNRPEFRELAPFMFYDFKMDASRVGNPNLKTAYVNNLDLRYELYPREGEVISIGGFYKLFNNPIETQIFVMTEQPGLGYLNAKQAVSYGTELEFRKSFKGFTPSRFMDRLSVNLNASLIRSEVRYDSATAKAQDQKRALQGQSPYILNLGLYYRDPASRADVSLSYNIFGPRIFAVGSYLFPAIYELPRHSVDLTISKKFGEHIVWTLGVQDLLNAAYRFYQDSDVNGVVDAKNDHPIFTYRRGSLWNLTFGYNF